VSAWARGGGLFRRKQMGVDRRREVHQKLVEICRYLLWMAPISNTAELARTN